MEISFAGLLVCAVIFLISHRYEFPLVVALITSCAFGATAVVNLPSLGGSSPLVYVVFAAALIAYAFCLRDSLRNLTAVCFGEPVAGGVMLLAIYAIAGAALLPRLFAGESTVFVPQRLGGDGAIVEVLLSPVGGNITQLSYLLVGILTFFALLLLRSPRKLIGAVKHGLFAWAAVHIAFGYLDLLGKLAGAGDVLAPIRTASYAMLTVDIVAGFPRVAGAFSEASAFGAMTVAVLAFVFSYWKGTGNRFALALLLLALPLLVLSTSSTAYVAGLLLVVYLSVCLLGSVVANRLRTQDVLVLTFAIGLIAMLVGIELRNASALDPFSHLFDATLWNKASSGSAAERSYWNWTSLQSVADTMGLGVGLGSSRASSWVIAVISQLGVPGALLLAALTGYIARGPGQSARREDDGERAIVVSARAACLAALLTASVSGSEANPGMLYFITLAATVSFRQLARRGLRASRDAFRGDVSPKDWEPLPVPRA